MPSDKVVMHLEAPAGDPRRNIGPGFNSDRLDKHVILQKMNMLDNLVVRTAGNTDLIPQRVVRDHIAQPDTASVGAYRNVVLGRNENNR